MSGVGDVVAVLERIAADVRELRKRWEPIQLGLAGVVKPVDDDLVDAEIEECGGCPACEVPSAGDPVAQSPGDAPSFAEILRATGLDPDRVDRIIDVVAAQIDRGPVLDVAVVVSSPDPASTVESVTVRARGGVRC